MFFLHRFFFSCPTSSLKLYHVVRANYGGRQGQTRSNLRKHKQIDEIEWKNWENIIMNLTTRAEHSEIVPQIQKRCKHRKRQQKCFQPTLKVLNTAWTCLLRFVTHDVTEVGFVYRLVMFMLWRLRLLGILFLYLQRFRICSTFSKCCACVVKLMKMFSQFACVSYICMCFLMLLRVCPCRHHGQQPLTATISFLVEILSCSWVKDVVYDSNPTHFL